MDWKTDTVFDLVTDGQEKANTPENLCRRPAIAENGYGDYLLSITLKRATEGGSTSTLVGSNLLLRGVFGAHPGDTRERGAIAIDAWPYLKWHDPDGARACLEAIEEALQTRSFNELHCYVGSWQLAWRRPWTGRALLRWMDEVLEPFRYWRARCGAWRVALWVDAFTFMNQRGEVELVDGNHPVVSLGEACLSEQIGFGVESLPVRGGNLNVFAGLSPNLPGVDEGSMAAGAMAIVQADELVKWTLRAGGPWNNPHVTLNEVVQMGRRAYVLLDTPANQPLGLYGGDYEAWDNRRIANQPPMQTGSPAPTFAHLTARELAFGTDGTQSIVDQFAKQGVGTVRWYGDR